MYLLKLFRDWFNENVVEFDRNGISREVIAQKAFIAGYNVAQQKETPKLPDECAKGNHLLVWHDREFKYCPDCGKSLT